MATSYVRLCKLFQDGAVLLAIESLSKSGFSLALFFFAGNVLSEPDFALLIYIQALLAVATIFFQLGIEQPLFASIARTPRFAFVKGALVWRFSIHLIAVPFLFVVLTWLDLVRFSFWIFLLLALEILSPIREWMVAVRNAKVLAISSVVALAVSLIAVLVTNAYSSDFSISKILVFLILFKIIHLGCSWYPLLELRCRSNCKSRSYRYYLKLGYLQTSRGLYVLPQSLLNSVYLNIVPLVYGASALAAAFTVSQKFTIFAIGLLSAISSTTLASFFRRTHHTKVQVAELTWFFKSLLNRFLLVSLIVATVSPLGIFMTKYSSNYDVYLGSYVLIVWLGATFARASLAKLFLYFRHGSWGPRFACMSLLFNLAAFSTVSHEGVSSIAMQLVMVELIIVILAVYQFARLRLVVK